MKMPNDDPNEIGWLYPDETPEEPLRDEDEPFDGLVPLSVERIKELAREIATNLVFTDRHLGKQANQLMGNVFMPLLLGAFKGWTKEQVDEIGMIYANYSDSLTMQVNGFPIFHTIGFCNKADAQSIWEKVAVLQQVMEDL